MVSGEYTAPDGLLYFGTHHMPLICGSAATSFSTASMSGPSSCSGTVIISMPNSLQIEKCRS